MEDYVEIKAKDLKEGQRFWRCLSDVGGATVERIIRDGVEVWADGEKWNCGIPQPNETVYAKSIINTGDTMEDLKKQLDIEQIKLGQNVADRKSLEADGEVIAKKIESFMDQIAEAEVTYSIGDMIKSSSNKYIIAEVGDDKVSLINTKTGKRYATNRVEVSNNTKITLQEFKYLTDGYISVFVRYWDNRKQEKC